MTTIFWLSYSWQESLELSDTQTTGEKKSTLKLIYQYMLDKYNQIKYLVKCLRGKLWKYNLKTPKFSTASSEDLFYVLSHMFSYNSQR